MPSRNSVESVGLPARPVQGEHELRARALLQRTLGDQRLERGYELRPPSERQLGLDPLLHRKPPQLLEARRLRLDELLVRKVCERRSAPERKSRAERRRAIGRLLPRSTCQEPLELEQIELARPHLQQVPGAPCLQRVPRGPECLPKVGDVDLDRLCGGPGQLVRPELLRESIGRDDLVRMEEQNRERRALPRCAEVEAAVTVERFERPEHLKPHGATVLLFTKVS